MMFAEGSQLCPCGRCCTGYRTKWRLVLQMVSLIVQEEIVSTLLLFCVLEQRWQRHEEEGQCLFKLTWHNNQTCFGKWQLLELYLLTPTEPIECEFVHQHLDGIELVDARPEIVWVPSERDLQQRQEAVHPGQQTLGTTGRNSLLPPREIYMVCGCNLWGFGRLLRVSCGAPGGNAVKHDDSVGQVCRHDEVVLHHKRRLLGVEDVPETTKEGCWPNWTALHRVRGGRRRTSTSWWPWRPSISARSPGRLRARRSGRRRLVCPDTAWGRLSAAHHQTGSAPGSGGMREDRL